MSKYLLDTDVFIASFMDYYAPRLAPTFWQWLKEAHQAGIVYSIDRVWKELQDTSTERKQQLHSYLESLGNGFFLPSNCDTVFEVARYIYRKTEPSLRVKRKFARTDLFLVALAKKHGYVVVTLETTAKNDPAQIKIPDVCKHYGVRCIRTSEMLIEQKLHFVLRQNTRPDH